MNLENVKTVKYYAIDGKNVSIQVIDKNDKCFSVPITNENTDYQNILEWVADGNTIQEAD
jgi:hypothetical protein